MIYFKTDRGVLHQGHVMDVLKEMADESVHCCITSPPYWGLRDYGIEGQVWDGDWRDHCEHVWGEEISLKGKSNWDTFDDYRKEYDKPHGGQGKMNAGKDGSQGQFCQHCNAWKGSLGLEPTPELFISHIVQVFREVKRVLYKSGCIFVNLGDSYWGSGQGSGHDEFTKNAGRKTATYGVVKGHSLGKHQVYKPKDLCGIPWRVALALQADGWYLRSAMPWVKRSAMPESCTDRPASALEYMFLLAKSQHYFFDMDAIRISLQQSSVERAKHGWNGTMVFNEDGKEMRSQPDPVDKMGDRWCPPTGRNFRNTDFFKWSVLDDLEKQNMQCMPDNQADNGFLFRQNRKAGSTSRLQNMLSDIPTQVCKQPKDTPEISKESTGASETELQAKQSLLFNTQSKTKRVGEVQDISEELLENGKRQREESDTESQKAGSNNGGDCGPNGQTMEMDKDGLRESVRLLQPTDETDNDGSHSTSEQGWNTHNEQHSSCVPVVQQQEEHQDGVRVDAPSDKLYQQKPIYTSSPTAPFGMISTEDELIGLDVNPQAMKEAHFATFSTKLVEPCLKAGTSEKGCCPECLAPWERVIERIGGPPKGDHRARPDFDENCKTAHKTGTVAGSALSKIYAKYGYAESKTIGWKPGCECYGFHLKPLHLDPVLPCTVLDPFFGSGTVAIVAEKHRRNWIGIELSTDYCDLAKDRIEQATKQRRLF